MTWLFARDWLRRRIEEDPEIPCEAGALHPEAPRPVGMPESYQRTIINHLWKRDHE